MNHQLFVCGAADCSNSVNHVELLKKRRCGFEALVFCLCYTDKHVNGLNLTVFFRDQLSHTSLQSRATSPLKCAPLTSGRLPEDLITGHEVGLSKAMFCHAENCCSTLSRDRPCL